MKKMYLFLVMFFLLGIGYASITKSDTKTTPEQFEAASSSFMTKSMAIKLGLVSPHKIAPNERITILKTSGGKTAYGYCIYDDWIKDLGVVSFNVENPKGVKMSMLYKNKDGHFSSAGAVLDNFMYCYLYAEDAKITPLSLTKINLENGNAQKIADYSKMTTIFSDMTYDYTANKMYYIAKNIDGSQTESRLGIVNIEDGSTTEIATIKGMITLACNQAGQLFSIGDDGNLYKIDKTNGNLSLVGATGERPVYSQSMDFDHDSDELFWAGTNDSYEGFLSKVNTLTGATTRISIVGYNAQITGLYIPFTPKDNGIPDAPTNLVINPGENGTMSAEIKFNAPTTTVGGGTLSQITKIEIFREESLIKTFTSPACGSALTYIDTLRSLSANLYAYRVVATNTVGEGLSAKEISFIGEDKPAAPTNVILSNTSGNIANISWTAPIKGLNGGWIDAAKLSYTIKRMPGNKLMIENIKETTYTDNTITLYGNYSYTIEAKTSVGLGGRETSNTLSIGDPLAPPYTGLNSADEFTSWTVIDENNDGKTWAWVNDENAATYTYSETNAANDWLLSPPLALTSGKTYKITYYMNSGGKPYAEKLKVKIGKGASVAAQTTTLATYDSIINTTPVLKTLIYTPSETADFNIGFHAYSTANQFKVQISNFTIEQLNPKDLMALSIVGDTLSPTGVEKNYTVTIKNNGTETQSAYAVKLVKEDGSQLTIKHFTDPIAIEEVLECIVPYAASTEEKIKIFGEVVLTNDTSSKNNRTPEGLSVSFFNGAEIMGKVIDPLGAAVENATIKIFGTLNYETKTAADGTFSIESVLVNENYTLGIYKTGFAPYFKTFELKTIELDFGALQLANVALAPRNVVVLGDTSNANITWKEGSTELYRYDNGIVAGDRGYVVGTEKSVLGAVHRTPTKLESMSWWTVGGTDNGGPHTHVNVYVFDLNDNGEPIPTVLFHKKDCPNTDDQWSRFEFPSPIDCPRGFMIAISKTSGYVALGIDGGTSVEWPFMPNANYYAGEYTNGEFITVDSEMPRNFLIRGEGRSSGGSKTIQQVYKSPTTANHGNSVNILSGNEIKPIPAAGYPKKNQAKTESFLGYKVYRFLKENKADETKWTELTTNPITSLEYDDLWGTIAQGVYQYAIKGIYANNVISDPGFSNEVAKDMHTIVTIHVATNTQTNEADGATVTIKNKNGDAEHIYKNTVSNGKVVFTDVWKGTYDISITLQGFNEVEVSDLDWNTEKAYEVGPYMLNEIVVVPFNLEIVENGMAVERIFNWNISDNIEDDFESMPDFEFNSSGKHNWSYIDADSAETFGLGATSFPKMGAPMAYVAFNPSKTTPQIATLEAFAPHSGAKYLASFAAVNAVNNDYFISPELNFGSDFVFRFWAKSYTAEFGLERMKVTYSTTGNKAEDFTHPLSTGDYVEVPTAWTKYSFIVPGNAKFVSIQCVSSDAFVFMLDDVVIGREKPKALTNYAIYLDGEKVDEVTNATTYTFKNLTQGNHVAGVKAMYTSGATDLQTVDFSVFGTKNKYRVTYNIPANGTLRVLNGSVPVEYGALVEEGTNLTIETTPIEGYEVKTLTANGANIINDTITVGNTAVEIFVEFALKQHTITVVQVPNGLISIKQGNTPINSGDKINYGIEIAIVAEPNLDFELDHISINENKLESGVNTHKVIEDIVVSGLFKYGTGIFEPNSTINLSVYPNPIEDVLHVKGEYQFIEIFDVNGRLVLTANGQATINVSELTKGFYILKATNKNKVGTCKIVK